MNATINIAGVIGGIVILLLGVFISVALTGKIKENKADIEKLGDTQIGHGETIGIVKERLGGIEKLMNTQFKTINKKLDKLNGNG